MTDPRTLLADRLALAIVEHGPSSGTDLALWVAARKQTVLETLRADRRFESLGLGRGSRWRLAAGNRYYPAWEPLGTDPGDGAGETLPARVAALERRVAELERALVGGAAA